MKNFNLKSYRNILCLSLFLTVTLTANAQTGSAVNASDPAMSIAVKDGVIFLTCRSGCAWTDLSFTLMPDQDQLVTEYGMSNGEKETVDPNLSNFMFSVRKNKDQDVTFKNISGMSFKKLKFPSEMDSKVIKSN